MKPLDWRVLADKFRACLRDDRGSALTEYSIMTMAVLPVVFYLFNPGNGLYQDARDKYELTTSVLLFPGP
jgi:hypothetical protein